MIKYISNVALGAALFSSLALLAGCTGDTDSEPAKPSAFALRFTATADGKEIGCTDTIASLGPDEEQTVGLSDLRFYISNVAFMDARGERVGLTLDQNEFQYVSDAGAVALIDLTGNAEGSCSDAAVAFAEGTARTHAAVTGTAVVEDVASVAFDIGVPQALMKQIIANNTAEGAPSPLNEMYWSWASGYRHFVMNFTINNGSAASGDGYLHLGSRDCGPADGLALEDRDACTFLNTPKVSFADFDLATDAVRVELPAVTSGLDFVSPIYDMTTFEVIGEGPGVECHSSPMQPDCASIFSNFGVDLSSGTADASANKVFFKK